MREEIMKLAEEVYNEEYSGGEYCHEQSFLWGFQEAYNALTALYKDKFELVKRMREAQKKCDRFICTEIKISFDEYQTKEEILKLESEVDEWIEKLN